MRAKVNLKPTLAKIVSETDSEILYMIITTTSIITVTPRATFVKGPLALNSFTTAIAEEGDRATIIAPTRREAAARCTAGMDFIIGMISERRKKEMEDREAVGPSCE